MKPDPKNIVIIEKVIAGGMGLGHLDSGMVVLAPKVLPEEEIRFRIIKRHKDYLEAECLEIFTPSPFRVIPQCPLFGKCGGCDLQHVVYDYQLVLKDAIVRDLLVRGGVGNYQDIQRIINGPILPSPKTFGYRQRIRLQVDPKTSRPGYYQIRSHKVVPVDRCPLAGIEINQALSEVGDSEHFQELLNQTQSVEFILSPVDEKVILLLHYQRKPRPQDRNHAEQLMRNTPVLKNILFSVADFGLMDSQGRMGEAAVFDSLVHFKVSGAAAGSQTLEMTLEPGGFCQVNLEQNDNLVKILLEWTDPGPDARILDLFCGMGNFSLPLAGKAAEVIGMDLQRSSVRSAKRNALIAGLENCRFDKMTAVEAVKKLYENNERFETILLDPPREGCNEVIPFLEKIGAGMLIYISCDPSTLARDLGLLRDFGYIVDRLQVVDMFPQTHHMETIVRLVKN
ncbi:MAG: 23S rRNA (uracil(1939)-C(5))-methyltransferase RlmD [Proteobacteria bacterium]|nr:23S rRNA (uracil(1939)-C(5))-methyltransferase RlmD [Pseudomonadota bacterium]